MKFVKINCDVQGQYPEWFLELSAPNMGLQQQLQFHQNMVGYEMKKLLHREVNPNKDLEEIQSRMATERLNTLIHNHIDYNELIEKYGTIYVRQIGSWMTKGNNQTIIAEYISDSWPTENEGAEIVICENDMVAEPHWLEYLAQQFPNKKINVLNNFRDRSIDDVQKHFEAAKYITFSTTFSNYDWFEKMLTALEGYTNKIVIGHCFDDKKFDKVDEIFKDRFFTLILYGNTYKWVKNLS